MANGRIDALNVLRDRGLLGGEVDGGGNSGSTIAYSPSIPFTSPQADMGIRVISGATTLTAVTTGAVRGSSCLITFIADGTNAPALSGMVAHGSDATYSNIAGVVNTLWMWYDGVRYYYQWSQDAAKAPVDLAPPYYASSVVADANKSLLVLTMTEALSGTLPAVSAFAVTVNGAARAVNSLASGGSTIINLTLASPIVSGDNITLSYAKPGANPLKDAVGNETASFGPNIVTNSVLGDVLRLATGVGSPGNTESGDGTAGFSYVGVSGALLTGSIRTGATLTVPVGGGDFEYIGTVDANTDATNNFVLNLANANTGTAYNSANSIYGLHAWSSYRAFAAGQTTVVSGIAPLAGDLVRIKRVAAGGGNFTLTYAYFRAGAWNVFATFTETTTIKLWPQANFANIGKVNNLRVSGMT